MYQPISGGGFSAQVIQEEMDPTVSIGGGAAIKSANQRSYYRSTRSLDGQLSGS